MAVELNSLNKCPSSFLVSRHFELYYRNKTDLELVGPELQIRIKCRYTCSYFRNTLSLTVEFSQKNRANENMTEKSNVLMRIELDDI